MKLNLSLLASFFMLTILQGQQISIEEALQSATKLGLIKTPNEIVSNTRNGDTKCLDSIHISNYVDLTNDFDDLYLRDLYSYDQNNNSNTTYIDSWSKVNNDWTITFNSTTTSLAANNNLLVRAFKSYDYNLMELTNLRQINQTFDGDLLQERLESNPDPNDPVNAWVNSFRTTYSYLEDSRPQYYLTNKWNETNENWTNNNRATFDYFTTTAGLDSTTILKEEWNPMTTTYEPIYLDQEIVNDQGLVTFRATYTWDNTNMQWLIRSSMDIEFNNDNQPTLIQFLNYEDGLLYLGNKSVSTYDINGNLLEKVFFNALEVTVDVLPIWEIDFKLAFTYDIDNFLIADTSFVYDAAIFDYTFSNLTEYTYDMDGTILFKTSSTWDENSWKYTILREYFYSIVLADNQETILPRSNCIMANPYTKGRNIFCDQLISNQNYQLKVYDLLGKKRYHRSFRGGETTSINESLPFGTYIINIENEEGLVYQQKIVIQ